jgi:peptide/nickel transport system substrate-binding protein
LAPDTVTPLGPGPGNCPNVVKSARKISPAKKLAAVAKVATTQKSPGRRFPFAGVLVSLALVAAYAGWQYFTGSTGSTSTDTATSAPARGGQAIASMRTELRTFNRLVAKDAPVDLVSLLTQGRLLRINRSTFELEPWLAETWESSPDHRRHTLHLRRGVTWSDGTPFTSADVAFTMRAVFDKTAESVLASVFTIGGQPVTVETPDAATVVLTFAAPSGAGLNLLDALPILPRHKLEAALDAGTFKDAWGAATPPSEMTGTGPFILREYLPGQRLVFERNPSYWRKDAAGGSLPYLDRLILLIVPNQDVELVRLQAGETDMVQSELRPEDYVPVRRSEEEGKLKLVEQGVSTDADALWFCLKPEVKARDPRFAFVQRREFRQALSHAVDREAFAQQVFLGSAVPVWGPVTPGNEPWFTPNQVRYPPDPARAKAMLASIGLEDRNGNGVVEDTAGTEARFSVITQQGLGHYERGTAAVREAAAAVGIALDIVPMDFNAMITRMLACDYDAIYMRVLATDLDPAGNLDFWLSSGEAHVWNLAQKTPATQWERQIDALMTEQASTTDPARRRVIFNEVQTILGENVPMLFFAAPRLYTAHSARLTGVVPSVMRPPILWSADTLSVR